ncbi:MAG: hypothetical protein QXX07_00095 [Candidatus Aenigmatarchaeota archaeon]
MERKGFVFVVEMISAVIILFVMFNFFFPSLSFKHNWDKVWLNLISRDIILSMERNKELYLYSFESPEFLYQKNLVNHPLVAWTSTENAVKKKITIACKCSDEVINELGTFLNTITLNGREIKFEIVSSSLTLIPSSDVLLIWGYNNLNDYFDLLKNFLAEDKGIVEVSDITYTQLDADEGHKKIFGLVPASGYINNIQTIELSRKPENSRDIVYGPWKYLRRIFGSPYTFSSSFNLANITAKSEANILFNFKNSTGVKVPAVILNKDYGRTAWVANLTKDGSLDDKEKWILTYLILWASNKHEENGKKVLGYENSYINVYKGDFFEVYAFTLGLGYS